MYALFMTDIAAVMLSNILVPLLSSNDSHDAEASPDCRSLQLAGISTCNDIKVHNSNIREPCTSSMFDTVMSKFKTVNQNVLLRLFK